MSVLMIAILLLGLVGAYLLGSIPTGFVLGKALKGIDIREHGSGNTGATNVFRVMGKGAGVTALAIDLLKGVGAVLFIRFVVSQFLTGDAAISSTGVLVADASAGNGYFAGATWMDALAALFALIGHSKSVWIGFSGGKSAATSLGVLLALAWPVALSVASVFGVALAVSRTVSVGSIMAALSAGVFMWVTGQPLAYLLLAIAGGFYVVLRHRSNISRLLEGTEPKTFGS